MPPQRSSFLKTATGQLRLVVVLKILPGATPNVRKGEQRTVHFRLQYQKTDSGWKAVQMKDSGSKLTQ